MITTKDGEGDKDWDSTAFNMLLVNETERFIDSHLSSSTHQDDPFFAYVSLGSVHAPHSPPYLYLDGSRVAGEYESKHMDLLGELDKVVGSLIEILETRSLLEDTVIIFTSDNGGLSNSEEYGHKASGPLRGYKGQIHEGGHRVPMIMRWDGMFPSGERRDYHLSMTDIFATLCEIAGINVPENQAVDSLSFANYIYDVEETSSLRSYLGTWRYTTGVLVQESIRKGRFKLIKHNWDSAIELFDLNEDLSEVIDLASDPIYGSLIDELLEELVAIGPGVNFEEGQWGIGANSSWVFYLLPKNPDEGKDKNRFKNSCNWFARKKTEERCAKYEKGIRRCTYTCTDGIVVPRPSLGPSISPSLLRSSFPSRNPSVESSAKPSLIPSSSPTSGNLSRVPSAQP
jgi:hypothetical protein